jgi:hypothetical protein
VCDSALIREIAADGVDVLRLREERVDAIDAAVEMQDDARAFVRKGAGTRRADPA